MKGSHVIYGRVLLHFFFVMTWVAPAAAAAVSAAAVAAAVASATAGAASWAVPASILS